MGSEDYFPFVTLLFVPADRPDRFEKAAASGADAIIIDLEDAVAPQKKDEARRALVAAALPHCPTIVRVNAVGSPWWEEDIEAVGKVRISAILLPKTEAPSDIDRLRDKMGDLPPVIALIETAQGLANARSIAKTPGVARLAFGGLDFALDVGCVPDDPCLRQVRFEIVLTSRLAEIEPPVDGVTPSFDDPLELERAARDASAMGFTGKLSIHPRQIAPIVLGFTPSEAELAWAQSVAGAPDGASAVGSAMVDAPVRRRAERILARRK